MTMSNEIHTKIDFSCLKKSLEAIFFFKCELKSFWRKSLYAPLVEILKILLDWLLNNDKIISKFMSMQPKENEVKRRQFAN